MKYKTLFRLMLKAIGVWVTITGGSQFLIYMSYFLQPDLYRATPYFPWRYLLQCIGPTVQLSVGLYLFFGGKWIADKAIPSNRPYCHECGYDLTGAVGDVCTECGTPFRAPMAQPHE